MILPTRRISLRVLVIAGFAAVAGCDCETTLRNWINQTSEESRTQLEPEGDAGESDRPDDREPNDSLAKASEITLSEGLQPIQGSVSRPGDLDWYKLASSGEGTWVVDFEIAAKGEQTSLDPYALVAIGSTTEEASKYRYERHVADEPLMVRRIELGASPMWLAIGGRAGTTGRYEVDIQKRLSAAAVEREPNDTPERATQMSYPGEVQGFFDRENDVDFYKLPKQKNAAAIHRFQLAPTRAQPYRIQLFKKSPEREPFATFQVPTDERVAIPNLGIPVGRADVWLRVTPLAPEEGGKQKEQATGDAGVRKLPDPTASYRIRIIRHPPAKTFTIEGEPNSSVGSGFRVDLGTTLRGYLHDAADRDVVRVAVGDPPEPGDAGVGGDTARGPEDVGTATEKPDVSEVGDAGVEKAVDPYAALPQKEVPSNLIQVGVETLRENKPVQIELLGYPSDPAKHITEQTDESGRATVCNVPVSEGFVEVAVSRPRGVKSTGLSRGYDYQLVSVDILPELASVEVEPNDRRSDADRLVGEKTGFITSSNDRDVYAFRVGEAQKNGAAPDAGSPSKEPSTLTSVSIALKVQELDLRFSVTDAAGAPIARVDRAGTASDEKTQLDLPDGVYFLTVQSRRGGSCKPYTISVETK